MTTMKKWEIIHITEKPQISITDPPCVDVVAAVIEPKLANTLIRRLNQVSPLEILTHVKRVRKSSVEGGKIQLSVVLCLSHGEGEQLESIPSDILEHVHAYQLSPFIAKVAKYAASSREVWKEQCKLWPTSYHPPTYNIDGITGFSEEDSKTVFNFMKLALKLTNSGPQMLSAHRRWEVYRGESSDLLFSVKKSSMLQVRTSLDVFHASNTSEDVCDFKIKGSWFERSCIVYLGDSTNIVAQMHKKHSVQSIVLGKDTFMVTVYPHVDHAFIVALIVILNEINEDRNDMD